MRMRPRRLRDFTRFCSAECEESHKLSFIFEDLEDRMKAREESIKETKTNNYEGFLHNGHVLHI